MVLATSLTTFGNFEAQGWSERSRRQPPSASCCRTSGNPFFPEILDGITDTLRSTDYHVLLGPSCDNEEDETAGAELVVAHLAALGHRRIAHIEHHETDPARLAEMPNTVRADGYRTAMQARGLEVDIVSTSYTQEGGYLGAQQILARPEHPTAIFAGADIVAMGVLTALAEAGLSVPADISLAGYDNTSFAALGPISLTSVDQAGRHIGTDAARLLLERIADRSRPAAQIKLSPTLVARRTTAPPR